MGESPAIPRLDLRAWPREDLARGRPDFPRQQIWEPYAAELAGEGLILAAGTAGAVMTDLAAGAFVWQVDCPSTAAAIDARRGRMALATPLRGIRARINIVDGAAGEVVATAVADRGLPVGAMAFSKDGSLLATGQDGGEVAVFDARTGEERARVEDWGEDVGEITSVAVSPDGRLVAVASHYLDVVVLLRVEPGGLQVAARWHTGGHNGREGAVQGLAFSPDGRLLAAGAFEAGLRLWDVTREREAPGFGEPERTTVPAFSPDGQMLAAVVRGRDGGEVALRAWHVQSRQQAALVRTGRPSSFRHLSFGAGGRLVASDNVASRVFTLDPRGARHHRPAVLLRFGKDGRLEARIRRPPRWRARSRS